MKNPPLMSVETGSQQWLRTYTVEDARAMVRLVADTAAHGQTIIEKKRFLLGGLSRLVRSDAWGWALSCQMVPGEPQIYVSFVHGGFSDERFTRLMAAYDHPQMARIGSKIFAEVERTGGTVTMSRSQIDPAGEGFTGEVGALWEAADTGHLVLSFTPLDATSASGVGIFRRLGDPDFTEREISILHVVLTEIPWLHRMGWPEDRGATVPVLAPRARMVLNLLLSGLSRKEVAGQMGISMHTLGDYIKEVFKHFQVHSHAGLMRRFYQDKVIPDGGL